MIFAPGIPTFPAEDNCLLSSALRQADHTICLCLCLWLRVYTHVWHLQCLSSEKLRALFKGSQIKPDNTFAK